MKLFVAVLLLLSIFSSGAVAQNQTTPQRPNQSAVKKPRSETIRICQGVPIHQGYVIIAYMTSSACSHGAYLLKKQDDYESSLAVNGSARQPAEESAEPAITAAKPSISTAQRRGTSKQSSRRSAPPVRTSPEPRTTPAQAAGDSATPARMSATLMRPRRVGTAESQEGPPALIGSEPAQSLRPPMLAKA